MSDDLRDVQWRWARFEGDPWQVVAEYEDGLIGLVGVPGAVLPEHMELGPYVSLRDDMERAEDASFSVEASPSPRHRTQAEVDAHAEAAIDARMAEDADDISWEEMRRHAQMLRDAGE